MAPQLNKNKAPTKEFPLIYDVQLQIFEAYFQSFDGHFVARLPKPESGGRRGGRRRKRAKSERAIEPTADADHGPVALLLANRSVSAIALVASLKVRTTIFDDSEVFQRYMHRHAQQDTARHLRSITLDVTRIHSLRSYATAMAETAFHCSPVKSIELLVKYDRFCYIDETTQRKKIIQDFQHLLPLLPTGLKYYTVRCPQLEAKVQQRLNNIVCAACYMQDMFRFGCFQIQCLRKRHLCVSEKLTPRAFEALSDKDKLTLVERRQRDPRWGRIEDAADRASRMLERYLEDSEWNNEYQQWKALGRINEELGRMRNDAAVCLQWNS